MAEKEALIKAAFEKWTERLGLGWWEVVVRYYDDPGEIIQRFRQDDNILVLACTYADWRYGKATIDINLPAWEEIEDEKVERIVVHELMHVLVNEMREGEIHHEERVVTQLTKAIFWVDAAAAGEKG